MVYRTTAPRLQDSLSLLAQNLTRPAAGVFHDTQTAKHLACISPVPPRCYGGVKVEQQEVEGRGGSRIHGRVWGLLWKGVEQFEEMRRQRSKCASNAFGQDGGCFGLRSGQTVGEHEMLHPVRRSPNDNWDLFSQMGLVDLRVLVEGRRAECAVN
jgi:hypothetical protein